MLALGLLQCSFASAAGAESPLHLSAWIGYEYDDNIASSEVDASTSQGDSAGVIELAARFDAFEALESESGLEGRDVWLARSDLEFGYAFYQSWRDDFEDYDLRLHLPSLRVATEFHGADWSLEYRYGHTTLGDDTLYESQRLLPAVGVLVLARFYLTAEFPWEHRDFVKQHPVATLTSARDAEVGGMRLGALYLLPERWGNLALRYAVTRHGASGPAFDYSANEVELRATLRLPPLGYESEQADPAELRFAYGYTRREYDVGRDDRRNEWLAAVEVPIAWRLRARLGYERFDSESPLASADYVSNVVSLMLGAAY